MISYSRIVKGSNAELIAHKKTRIISAILLAFAGLIYGFATTSRGDNVDPSPLGIFIYFVSLFPLFSCCSAVFKDMHDIPTADVQMSMPLSSSERYFSRLLTIARIWLIPFLISAAAAIALSAAFGGINGSLDQIRVNGHRYQYHPEVLLAFNLNVLLWFMAAALFIIAVTVVCQCCIGAKAESRYLPVLVMIALSSFAPAMFSFFSEKFADVSVWGGKFFYSVWTFSALATDFDSVSDTILMVINCLISLAVIFGGLFICRKRDARSVGKPIVFPLFFELIMAICLSLFFLLFHIDFDSLVIMFLAWLGSIILRIVVSRKKFSFSKIGIWTCMFIGYYLIFLLFMYIAFLTGGFGLIGRTPADNVYAGYKCNAEVEIYKSRNYYYYSNSDDSNELIDSDIDLLLTESNGNRDRVKAFVKSVSSAARRQSRIKGLFSHEMFDSTAPSNLYYCRVRIRMYEEPDSGYDTVYSADFYLNQSDAENLVLMATDLENCKY